MRNLKTLMLAAIVTGGWLLTAAAPAVAHEPGYRYDRTHYRPAYPRWLRDHRDFHRWYRHNHYRVGPRLSWQRLYHLYRDDRHYHRKFKRKYHDRHRRSHRRHRDRH